MVDKEKRLQKLLSKARLKGKLKSVKTLEEAGIVFVEDPRSTTKNSFFDKIGYEYAIANGYNFPEDKVHFLIATNPRNRQLVERSVLTNNRGLTDLSQ